MPGYKNRLTAIGNVSQAPKVNYTQGGNPVCNFSMATNHSWTNKQTNERETLAQFFNCTAFDRLVPLTENLQVGQYIEIEGRVKTDSYHIKCKGCGEQIKQWKTEVILTNILYLTNKNENPGNERTGNQGNE